MSSSHRHQAIRVANRFMRSNPTNDETLHITARRPKVAVAIGVGDSFENELFRIHRFRHAIRVTDLTNAGKRGKSVNQFSLYDIDFVNNDKIYDRINQYINTLPTHRSFASAMTEAEMIAGDAARMHLIAPKFDKTVLKSIEVAPAGFKPFKVEGRFVTVEADYNSFSVKDKVDKNNLPTCIPSAKGGREDVKMFFRWVTDNAKAIENMRFYEVLDAIGGLGIKYHSYCAMD